MPMPTASMMLASVALLEFDIAAPAKETPMHKPSGILWSEIAIVLKIGSRNFPSKKPDKTPFFATTLFIKNSMKITKNMPKNTPKVQTMAGFCPFCSPQSIPTKSKEKMLDAIMMPAEKLKTKPITFLLIWLNSKTTAPPMVVSMHAKHEKIIVSQNGEILAIFS